jgi:hypothetical protein
MPSFDLYIYHAWYINEKWLNSVMVWRWCIMLQNSIYLVRYHMVWYDIYDMIWYGMIYDMIYGMIWNGMIWYHMIYSIWYIWYDMLWYDIYDMISYRMIYGMVWYGIICNDTAIELTPGGSSKVHIYTQTTRKTTQHKQYTEQHNSLIRKSADRAPSLRGLPWHLPYNWGKSTEKHQSG